MSLSVEAVAVAKKYTDNSIKGISGALAGKNCTIKSIQKVNGVSTITFEWIADDGTVKTSTMNVMDGKDGKDGLNGKDGKQGADGSDGIGISKIEKISTVDLVDTYRITFTDNSTFDYEVTNGKDGQGGGTADVPIEKIKVNGELQTPVNKVVDITVPDAYDDTALSNRVKTIEDDYAKSSDIPSLSGYATETWVNEQGFLTQHQDLSNYATKDELPSLNGYATEDYVTEQISNIPSVDLTDYAKKNEIPTTVAELTDSADYAKKTDIPTTLPADGGNSDTVNNHTVESDVPVDAKFTDTIYDDTEVKKRISDNGYGEVSGGKNLLNHNIIEKITNCSVLFKNDTFYATNKGNYSLLVLSVPTIVGKTYTVTIKDWSDYSYRCIASVSDLSDNTLISMVITDATLSMTFTAVGTESLINISPNNTPNEMSNTITFKCMLEEGSVATEYKPYFPSNKMLAEENAQQSSNLDTLEYSEVAGGKNLANINDFKALTTNPSRYGYEWLSMKGGAYTFNITNGNNRLYIGYKHNEDFVNPSSVINNSIVQTITINDGDDIVIWYDGGVTGNTVTKIQLEVGSVATEYEPYIPSVKMLATENEQQNTEAMDLKMLGWTVPKECPIQNYVDGNGVFHQRVGRVDLGTLDWSYSSEYKRFSTIGITDYKKKESSSNTWVADAFLKDYSTTSGNNTASDSYNKSIGFNGTANMFFVKNTSYTDATSFKNAMQGQYLYYELATEISINVDGNEAVTKVNDSLSVIGKCKNLLKPVFVSGWGCNCVIGDDGKITLTSTNTEDYQVVIGYIHKCSLKANKTYYFRAFDIINIDHIGIGKIGSDDLLKSFYNQLIYTPTEDMDIQLLIYFSDKTVGTISSCYISVSEVYTDEYVPYTGDGDTLTHDVANLRGSLDKLVTYSTEEQIAGIYLDGKTIYRRSLEIQLDGELKKTLEFIYQGITALEGGEDISIYINQITPAVNLSEWNIGTMVKVYGHITDYTDSTRTEKNVDLPYPVTYNSGAYVTGWYDYKTKLYMVRVGEQYANKSTAFLTFEYTKI